MAEVVNLQEVLEALAASGADVDSLLTAVGETSSIPAGGFSSPVNVPYTLQSANGTNLANGVNAARSVQIPDNVINIGNSNVQGGLSGFNSSYGASAGAGAEAGTSTLQSGGELFKNGVSVGRTTSLLGTAASSIGVVAAGLTLGKTFAGGAYKIGKLMGIVEEGSALNPKTWNSLTYDMADTGLEGIYKRAFQLIICPKSTTGKLKLQAYMPEDTFDFMAWCMARGGVFSGGGYEPKPVTGGEAITITERGDVAATITRAVTDLGLPASLAAEAIEHHLNYQDAYISNTISITKDNDSYYGDHIIATFIPDSSVTIGQSYTVNSTRGSIGQASSLPSRNSINIFTRGGGGFAEAGKSNVYIYAGLFTGNGRYTLGNLYGTTTPSVEGVGTQPGAKTPNLSPNDTLQQVKDKLRAQYPELHDNRIEMPVAEPATVPKPVTYIPVPLPSQVYENMPTSEPDVNVQSDPSIDPQTASDPLSALLLKLLTNRQALNMPDPAGDPEEYPEGKPEEPVNTNPSDIGVGVTPPLNVPVGSASALWAVYNPTQAQIDALGAWLWSNNFVDQLLKMFNDPMQAIIGLHKTFIPPVTGSAQDIKVGYLNSGVSSLTVPVQYSSVDCGTVDCSEYFGNVFDYSPYTRVYIYLPFIGFKELDVAQVMRGKINVKYRGDAYTGCCLAEVSVTRDGESGGVLYTYSGDCAARYPLSHGSYMGIVNAIAGIGIGIGTALAGTPSVGIAGAVGMAQHARATVEHSGSFSGNSGAMGIKKPYLVIMRPQTAMAKNYEHFTGQPSNSNVVLGSASGYVRVKECHVEDIATATDAEKQMIESALKTGVII